MTSKEIVDIIFSTAIAAIGIAGLTFNCSIIKKGICREIFVYYTNLSNIAVILYQLLLLLSYVSTESSFHRIVSSSAMRLSVMLMIMLTFVIYHFILRRALKKKNTMPMKPEKALGNLCVHYIVPFAVFAQWILCANKLDLVITDGIIWIICPSVYMIFLLFRGMAIDSKRKKSGEDAALPDIVKYPYPFIDVDTIGSAKVALNVAAIAFIGSVAGCFAALLAVMLST